MKVKVFLAAVCSLFMTISVSAKSTMSYPDKPHSGAAPIVELGPKGCLKNCTLNNNIRFLIISLQNIPEVPTASSDTFGVFYQIQAKYDKVFGNGSVQIINGSQSTVDSLRTYLQTAPNSNIIGGLVQFLWVISNHGYRNIDGGSTHLYWGCGDSGCKQDADLKTFEDISLSLNPSRPFAMSWFDACYTHVPTDGIANVLDGTAAGWIHLYNKEAYACGFSNYTNGFDAAFTACMFDNALSKAYFKPGSSKNILTADQYNDLLNTCHQDESSSPIGNIALGAPYCSGLNTSSLPFGKFKYIRVVNDITQGDSNTVALIDSNNPSQSILLPPSSNQNPAVYGNTYFYQLIDKTTFTNAIQNNTLNKVLNHIVVKNLKTDQTSSCQDTLNMVDAEQIRFDSQFNGLNIVISETGNTLYCNIDYAYINGMALTGK